MEGMWSNGGMTLRDYFAAKAMEGMWSNKSFLGALDKSASEKNLSPADFISECAYEQADSMIAWRDKE